MAKLDFDYMTATRLREMVRAIALPLTEVEKLALDASQDIPAYQTQLHLLADAALALADEAYSLANAAPLCCNRPMVAVVSRSTSNNAFNPKADTDVWWCADCHAQIKRAVA
jgi:hypothetical protein